MNKFFNLDNPVMVFMSKIADLIIVDGNPLKDISVLQKVKLVVKDGVVVVDHLQ